MQTFLIILIVIAGLATLAVLIRGVIGMAQQTEISGQRSQDLMRKRVLFQAVTIVFAVLLLPAFGNRG